MLNPKIMFKLENLLAAAVAEKETELWVSNRLLHVHNDKQIRSFVNRYARENSAFMILALREQPHFYA